MNTLENISIGAIVAAITFLTSCNSTTTKETAHESNKAHKALLAHWSYEGEEKPENWKRLCKEYNSCGGVHQSPINIVPEKAFADEHLKPIDLKYSSTHAHIINNGHTVQFACDEGNKITTNDKEYQLKQFHFHTSSEHELKGQHFPMEVHFVHQAKDGSLAVVGVFFQLGETNEFLAKYLESTPHTEGEFEGMSHIKLAELMPHDPSYYHYDGSLTTPPCSEVVSWYLMDEPLSLSKSQLAEMHDIMHDNFRPVQPLNDRKLVHYAAH